ncbi:MAG: hypothetical protein PHW36_00825 [Bacilli bacterium]|nr:hypothetical protein [Bacilli bacterium]
MKDTDTPALQEISDTNRAFIESAKDEDADDMDDYGDRLAEGRADAKLSSQLFNAEELTYLGELKSTEIAQRLKDQILCTSLSTRCQNALVSIVDTYICEDVLLANINHPLMALNDFDISMSESVPCASICDTTQPEWLRLKDLMRNSYAILLTRTIGPYRERRLQDNNRVEVVTGKMSNSLPNSQPTKSRGKSLWKR